ncbi:thioesterase family protein [Zavarzinia sp. CC-PAN008]|uniref:thioesterase family protein n=1 Tax=Zavarzinia sp. CC-PAN008 TaxID=3243332 RepID=UPI003F746C25
MNVAAGRAAQAATQGQGAIALRTSVNTWECDQMGHMNVRFYGQHFDDADEYLKQRMGLDRRAGPILRPRQERLQFRRELHAGATILVRQTPVAFGAGIAGAGTLRLNAVIEDAVAGTLSANLDTDFGLLSPAGFLPLPALAALDLAEQAPLIATGGVTPCAAAADRLGLIPTYQGVVRPADCDRAGLLTRRSLITRCSDAIGHVRLSGMPSWEEMKARGLGSAALEYRIDWIAPPRAGDLIELRSGFDTMGPKTLHLFHWMLDAETGAACATIEVTAIYFSFETRKSIAIPDDIRAGLAAALRPWRGVPQA